MFDFEKRISISTSSKMKLSILICLVILIIGITSVCAITHEHKYSATHHSKLHHVPLIVGQGEDKDRHPLSILSLQNQHKKMYIIKTVLNL